MTRRGLFIVFEGLDRSGKSTQSKLLSSTLPNSRHFAFPNRSTTIGKLINTHLTSTETVDDRCIHLLFSANRWECSKDIVELLEAVVCDRYAYSGLAYSTAKGLPALWAKQTDMGLPSPDIVFYIEVDPTVASQREGWGEERYENLVFQTKVRDSFVEIMRGDAAWVRVDGNGSVATVGHRVMEIISGFNRVSDRVEMRLWM